MHTTSDPAAELLRQVLIADFARLAVAIVSMTIGIATLLLQWLRRKNPDRLRLWFGLLALLYGYRALMMTESVRYFLSGPTIEFQIGLVTFTIGIPGVLFGWGLVSGKPNRVVKAIVALNLVMAVSFLALFWSGSALVWLNLINNVLVITFTVAILVYLFRINETQLPDVTTLRIVMLVWGLFVIYNNVRHFVMVLSGGEDFEYIGFGVFLCSLAYLVARRSMQNEQALTAIRNELEIARRIQKSILPETMPQMPGLEVAARYVPMSEVAGDFYDFLQVDERRVGMLIADVSGHGIGAALVASMVKVAIAAQAEHADDPARVMAGLNTILSGKLQGQFVTAAYLFLDLENGLARYSAAGHPPLLHYAASQQTVHDVVENGLILGVMPFASYETKVLQVGAGDRFLLYTDGVVEAAHNGEEFGPERVKQVMTRSLDSEALCDSIGNEVRAWTRGVAGDDLTIVAIEVRPLAMSNPG